jgi:peptidoglycan/xylan/chitin deacetylase (PgdA/CDA1 family)
MYHAVKPEQRKLFEKHMEKLLRVGLPVDTSRVHTLKDCQHHIAVTFDDGFLSAMENALPVLREKSIPATLFVPAGYLGQRAGWIHSQKNENANENLLTERQLQQLPRDLITIGSHGMTHQRLAEIDPREALQEMVESKNVLEKIVNGRVTSLSFPHGSYNEVVIELARQAGYERVFSNVPIFPASRSADYVMGRTDMSLRDWTIEYRLKMAGAYQWMPLAMRVKRTLIGIFKMQRRERV